MHSLFSLNMKTLTLNDINLLDVGNTISLGGTIWVGNNGAFISLLPDISLDEIGELQFLVMNDDDWHKFLRQTDLQETEILQNDNGKIKKAIVRKTARVIDSRVQWEVFKRDQYTCQYCGRSGVPLTVDHIILWEKFGATVPENLLTACRKCNKLRGNTEYKEWIESKKYQKISKNNFRSILVKNILRIQELPKLEKLNVTNIKSR